MVQTWNTPISNFHMIIQYTSLFSLKVCHKKSQLINWIFWVLINHLLGITCIGTSKYVYVIKALMRLIFTNRLNNQQFPFILANRILYIYCQGTLVLFLFFFFVFCFIMKAHKLYKKISWIFKSHLIVKCYRTAL